MAIKVFPSANAVGGAAQKVLSESNLGTWLGATTPRNYIANGLDLSGVGTATLTISPGVGIINGRVVTVDEAIEIPVSGTGFYYCRLTLALDALGNVESAAAALVSTGTPATVNDLHLGHVSVSVGKVSYTDYSQGRYTSPHGTLYDSMVNRHVAFDTFFESIDGYQTSLTSSATAAIDPSGYLKLATSTTNGSSATISKRSFTDIGSRERPNFSFEQWLSIEGRVDGVALGAASEAWLIVGAPGVKRHIGFVSVNGQLFGTIGNGTTETRTEVLTEGTVTSLVAHHVPGQYVEFWADPAPLGRTVLTTGLPTVSQSAAADRCIMYASIKTSNTTAKELRISSWHWRQLR